MSQPELGTAEAVDVGDDSDPRGRRVSNEWYLLQALAVRNPATLQVLRHSYSGGGDLFFCSLQETCGIALSGAEHSVVTSHFLELCLPRFFPFVPIEVRLVSPVFHPNVDPESGFVCLWERFSPTDSVMEAIRRLQRVIPWELFSIERDHVINPAAARWYSDQNRGAELPLSFTPLIELEGFRSMKEYARRAPACRRRLEPILFRD
jgi:hypothetical protein